MSLYTGDSIQSSESSSLSSSYIATSPSFGNIISQGLIGEVGYAYDALNGGFKYDMASRVNLTNDYEVLIDLSSELSKLDSPVSTSNNNLIEEGFSGTVSPLLKTNNLETTLTFGSNSLPVQSFFGSSIDSAVDLSDFETSYLKSEEGGLSLSANYGLENARLIIGVSNPVKHNNYSDSVIGSQQSIIASLEYGDLSDTSITLMSGITQEKDNLLGLQGSDAFSTVGAKSNTVFSALKAQSNFNENLTLTGIATLANTNMNQPELSFIDSANNVRSSSLALVASQKNITGDDHLSLSVSQPDRIHGGEMSIRMSNLAQSNGDISYRNKNIELKATGRQLVYGLSYRKDLDERFGFSLKHVFTTNLNHMNTSASVKSSYLGLKYKDLKLGYNIDSHNSLESAELSYKYSF
jgi:hypothetical protein